MKTIRVTLTPQTSKGVKTVTIEQAIKELEKYRDSLQRKSNVFIQRLAEIGVAAAYMPCVAAIRWWSSDGASLICARSMC